MAHFLNNHLLPWRTRFEGICRIIARVASKASKRVISLFHDIINSHDKFASKTLLVKLYGKCLFSKDNLSEKKCEFNRYKYTAHYSYFILYYIPNTVARELCSVFASLPISTETDNKVLESCCNSSTALASSKEPANFNESIDSCNWSNSTSVVSIKREGSTPAELSHLATISDTEPGILIYY